MRKKAANPKVITWGSATIEQHKERAEHLRKVAAEHEAAVKLIIEADASNLSEAYKKKGRQPNA